MMTRTDRRRFPILFAAISTLALPAAAKDDLPVLEFIKSAVAIEDFAVAKVFLKLDRAAPVPIKVHWETSDLSPATAVAGVDYRPASGTVTFAPGDLEEQFQVTLRNDDRVEDTEKFLITIRPANPALVTVPVYEREYTIVDTDELKLTVDVETVVREAARVAHVRVYAEEVPLDVEFQFDYETQPGTVVPEKLQGDDDYTAYANEAAALTYAAATEGADYRHKTGTLTFGPGAQRHTITVPLINDGAEEERELFQVWLVRKKETDRRILDPGRPARVVIRRSDYPLVSLWDAEGVEGEDMVFTVALSKATGADVTVDWTVDFWRGSTADAADFETMSGTATVAAGSREATFTVATADDAADEEDETFLVRLSNFPWNSQIGDPTATGVITDNDDSPFEPATVRSVTLLSGPGSDGVWSAGERVELEVRYSLPVVVRQPRYWVNADGDRHPPGPYVAVVFLDDARPGYGKGLSVALVPYVSGSGTAALRFAYTVGADEAGAQGVEVAEGILLRGATIRTLEGGVGEPEFTRTRVMQVDVRKPSGGVWPAGDKVRVEVRFTGPAQYTPPEEPQNRDEVDVEGGTPTIRLLLGDRERRRLARMASYAGGSGTNTLTFEYEVTAGDGQVSAVEVVAESLARNGATIRNEDGYDAELDHLGVLWYSSLALRVRAAAAREGGTLKFEMELAQAAKAPVTVDYETADGTATAGEDYTAKRGTVTFAPGHTRKTVAVPVLRDEEAEDAETVVLRLSNARSADSEAEVEVTVPEAEGTIEDVAPEAAAQEPPQKPPPAPRNLTGVANDDGSVTLSWDAPGDDSVTGYRILRRHTVKQDPGVFSTLAANTGTTATTYTDRVASPETRYAYRVKAINAAGAGKRSNYVKVTTKRAAPASKPALADVAPNAPNPFNASTLIPYRLDADGPVRLEIYNLLGQSIRTLVDEVQTAGAYRVSWDARDAAGRRVSTGVYFLRLHYPGGVQTRRMLYLE